MRYILSFQTSLNESNEYQHPRGYSIAEYLQSRLAEAGYKTANLENYRDMAWSVDCCIGSKQLYYFVGYLGTNVSDWQLIVCSGMRLLSRLLGQKDDQQKYDLARAIHGILSTDGRFSDLRWYPKYTNSGKDKWYPEPLQIETR